VFLSIALLTGLVLNYWCDLWQADPIVGLVIVIFLIKEGYNILKGED
jgi:divalent metal cation (Fe/Co/Zn/Cd) transporter